MTDENAQSQKKSPAVPKPLSPVGKVIFLIAITMGFAFMVVGISWLGQLGCAILLLSLVCSDRFLLGRRHMNWFGYSFGLLSLVSSARMFTQAYRYGYVWLASPPHWSWTGFISLLWLITVISVLKQKTRPSTR